MSKPTDLVQGTLDLLLLKILALESATLAGGAALLDGDHLVGESTQSIALMHSERLMAVVERLMSDCGWSPKELEGLAVSVGPGSFTGLRVGIATIKGLALALGLPVAAVPTLDALAATLPFADGVFVCSARRPQGEVYVALQMCAGERSANVLFFRGRGKRGGAAQPRRDRVALRAAVARSFRRWAPACARTRRASAFLAGPRGPAGQACSPRDASAAEGGHPVDLRPSGRVKARRTACYGAGAAPGAEESRGSRLERLSFKTPWSRASFRYEITQNRVARCLVVRLDGRLVGYLCLWEIGYEIHITNLAVHPDRRRQGLARSLIQSVLEDGRGRGVTLAFLEVRPTNSEALGLYESLGFSVIGRRKGYYFDTGEDALVMETRLAGARSDGAV